MTKIVYQVDVSGVYVTETEADESPLEPGVFLVPAGCVEAAPPETPSGSVAVWTDDSWHIEQDHRGETWYISGVATVVTTVGDPTESGYSSTAPEPTLDELRQEKISAVTAKADELLAAGAPLSGDLHVSLDDGSRADLTAMATTAIAATTGAVVWPESYSRGWISVENTRVPLPQPTDGLTLASSVGGYYASVVQHRRDLKDVAIAAADSAALDAIDVSAGWPTAT